ncbi:unnamed protein product, partial [Meganyctiphanes norvegica]
MDMNAETNGFKDVTRSEKNDKDNLSVDNVTLVVTGSPQESKQESVQGVDSEISNISSSNLHSLTNHDLQTFHEISSTMMPEILSNKTNLQLDLDYSRLKEKFVYSVDDKSVDVSSTTENYDYEVSTTEVFYMDENDTTTEPTTFSDDQSSAMEDFDYDINEESNIAISVYDYISTTKPLIISNVGLSSTELVQNNDEPPLMFPDEEYIDGTVDSIVSTTLPTEPYGSTDISSTVDTFDMTDAPLSDTSFQSHIGNLDLDTDISTADYSQNYIETKGLTDSLPSFTEITTHEPTVSNDVESILENISVTEPSLKDINFPTSTNAYSVSQNYELFSTTAHLKKYRFIDNENHTSSSLVNIEENIEIQTMESPITEKFILHDFTDGTDITGFRNTTQSGDDIQSTIKEPYAQILQKKNYSENVNIEMMDHIPNNIETENNPTYDLEQESKSTDIHLIGHENNSNSSDTKNILEHETIIPVNKTLNVSTSINSPNMLNNEINPSVIYIAVICSSILLILLLLLGFLLLYRRKRNHSKIYVTQEFKQPQAFLTKPMTPAFLPEEPFTQVVKYPKDFLPTRPPIVLGKETENSTLTGDSGYNSGSPVFYVNDGFTDIPLDDVSTTAGTPKSCRGSEVSRKSLRNPP